MKRIDPLSNWPELGAYAAGVQDVYGDNLEALWLFGSRARGNFSEDSDFDVAVVLKKQQGTRFDELKKISRVSHPLRFERGVYIHSLPVPAEEFERSSKPIYRQIRAEGIPLIGRAA